MIKIEPMTEAELEGVAAVERKSFSVPWSLQSFADELNNPHAHYFTAKEDGQVLGYAGVWLVVGEGQITNIAVLPEARRRGIATLLLNEILHLPDADIFTLEVRESNTAARRFYEKSGFSEVGRRKAYYHQPTEDAILMVTERK